MCFAVVVARAAGSSEAPKTFPAPLPVAAPQVELSIPNPPASLRLGQAFALDVDYTANLHEQGLRARLFLEIRDAATSETLASWSSDNSRAGYEGPSGRVTFACTAPAAAPPSGLAYFCAYAAPMEFNPYVIRELETYPRDGTYPYQWSGNGVTHNIVYLGTTILTDNQAGNACYCSGITYQVFMDAWEKYNAEKGFSPASIWGMTVSQARNFRLKWYAADGRILGSTGAIEDYACGFRITDPDRARPGDFVQIWRNSGSGHSVIFIEWIRNDLGEKTQIRYWSTQTSTNGINYNTENYSSLNMTDTTFARALKPADKDDWANRYAAAETRSRPIRITAPAHTTGWMAR